MEFEEQVQLPTFHFRKAAKREYRDWRNALIREFFQNSIDANATNITFTLSDNILMIEDNGYGMSEGDLRTKLLTMGGTNKTNQDVGGFGVAKQILYFAWNRWAIYSRNYKVIGSGCRYTVSSNEYTNGVTSVIELDDDYFTVEHITRYLRLCEAKAQVTVNDIPFTDWLPSGEAFRSTPWGVLYKKATDNPSPYMQIRVHGTSMFSDYIGARTNLDLILELTGNTREILSSTRDGLNAPFCNELSAIIQEIAVNPISATKNRNHIQTHLYEGRGTTTVAFSRTNISIEKLQEIGKKLIVRKTKNSTNLFHGNSVYGYEGDPITFETPKQPKDIIPSIFLKYVDQLDKRYDPKTWESRIKKMMVLWHRVIKQVLADNEIDMTFGIGMTLHDQEIEAELHTENGVPFILLNPDRWHYGKKKNNHIIPDLSRKRWLLVQEMIHRAAHEITHILVNDGHNETFISMFHAIIANTWKSENEYKKIAKLRKADFID